MAYEHFLGPKRQTATNELEGRIEKLLGDQGRALEDARDAELQAERRTEDAAEYGRLIDEYKTLLGKGSQRTTTVTLKANVDGYLEGMQKAKQITLELIEANEKAKALQFKRG